MARVGRKASRQVRSANRQSEIHPGRERAVGKDELLAVELLVTLSTTQNVASALRPAFLCCPQIALRIRHETVKNRVGTAHQRDVLALSFHVPVWVALSGAQRN